MKDRKSSIKIYFYHTQNVRHILKEWRKGKFPAHFLYGATEMKANGIDVVWHFQNKDYPRWRVMLITAWRLLFIQRHIDAVFATHYKGLEIIVLLRALHLYCHPIIVWHHQPIVTSKSFLREKFGQIFYKGFDRLVFFSQDLINESLHSKKADGDKIILGHWGADLTFYNRLLNEDTENGRFISTGKELRDMPTLLSAFNGEKEGLDIYISRNCGGVNYANIFDNSVVSDNISIHYISKLSIFELSQQVARASCVVICCKETRYTVGLTTLVEALALGKPVICSRNTHWPIDVDEEGCGISIPYYDVEGWRRAIRFIADNPDKAYEMGRCGRRLAERMYNNRQCGKEIADVIKSLI